MTTSPPAAVRWIAANWFWLESALASLAGFLLLCFVNGVKRYGDRTSLLQAFAHGLLDRLTVTANRDSPNTFKWIGMASRPPNSVHSDVESLARASTQRGAVYVEELALGGLAIIVLALFAVCCGAFTPAIAFRDGASLAVCGVDEYGQVQHALYDTNVVKVQTNSGTVIDAIFDWLGVAATAAHCIRPVVTDVEAAAHGQPVALEKARIMGIVDLVYDPVSGEYVRLLAGPGDPAPPRLPAPSIAVQRRAAMLKWLAHACKLW